MNKLFLHIYTGLLVTLLLIVPIFVSAQGLPMISEDSQSEQSLIRVGIWSNQPNILVGSDVDFNLVDGVTHELIGRYGAKDKVTITSRGGLFVNNIKTSSTTIELRPDTLAPDPLIEVNRHRYRGSIKIHQTHNKSGLTVVNTLPIDQYLYGVIPKEIPPDWNVEVLKAQAVAARTYALAHLEKHGEDGYGVCATTECQVYAGADSEMVRTNSAVDETSGLVMTYQGKLISAVFHASGGGYTEDSENVWGSFSPYLRGVVDYDQSGPDYRWEKQIKPSFFEWCVGKGRLSYWSYSRLRTFSLQRTASKPA